MQHSLTRYLLLTSLYAPLFCSRIAASGEDSVNNAATLRVITYNVQFLPDPVSWKDERPNPEYRARRIGEELRHFDIAGLQETFHERYRQRIIDVAKAGTDGALHQVVSPQPPNFSTNGGCLLLTRRPLLASSSIVFAHFSKPADFGFRADGFAAKGVIHGRVARSEQEHDNFIDVFVTHLEARADDLRPLQYKELAAFIRKESDTRRSMLLLGDLNTYGMIEYQRDPKSQYSQLIHELQAARSESDVVDVWPHLRDEARGGTTDQKSPDAGKRVDYIILGNPKSGFIRLQPQKIEVRTFQDAQVVALSDHNAVAAEFAWPAASDSEKH